MTIMFWVSEPHHLIKATHKTIKQIMQNKHQLTKNQKKKKKKKEKNLQLPELKLRKPANEGLEFIRTFRRQQSPVRKFHLRINQRRQEPNQQIQQINPQTIGDNVKTLNITNPQNVNQYYNKAPNPSIDRVWSSLI